MAIECVQIEVVKYCWYTLLSSTVGTLYCQVPVLLVHSILAVCDCMYNIERTVQSNFRVT